MGLTGHTRMPDTNCAKHIEQQTGEVELKNKIGLREAVV